MTVKVLLTVERNSLLQQKHFNGIQTHEKLSSTGKQSVKVLLSVENKFTIIAKVF